jgi:CubicO group peptidase (beta-lactamase class C family)
MTFGWILGEVLRRVDGRPIAQLVQRETEDFYGCA